MLFRKRIPKKILACLTCVSILQLSFMLHIFPVISPIDAAFIDTGDGADGSVTISSNKNINTDAIASGRTVADGESFAVSSLSTNTITATGNGTDGTAATSLSSSITIGDEVILINLRGSTSAYTNVGNYEFCEVQNVSSTTITCVDNLTKTYGESSNSDLSGQKVVVQRIPNYTEVTINSGINLTASGWDGTYGGVLIFKASSSVTVTGNVDLDEKGFRGGSGSLGDNLGYQGESTSGTGSQSLSSLAEGSGGGGDQHVAWVHNASGGGGGGYGSSGSNGNYCTQGGGRGAGGSTYGISDLSKIYLGSGGGEGGSKHYNWSASGGDGGNGGGIIRIITKDLSVTGTISADGSTGVAGRSSEPYTGGGGGGSGGTILIQSETNSLGTNLVTATGASGGSGHSYGGSGGSSGSGRIAIYRYNSVTGTTNPTANQYDADFGYFVQNLPGSLNTVKTSDWSTNVEIVSQTGTVEVGITDTSDNRIAVFDVAFSESRDWTNISAESSGNKAFFHYPGGFSSIPGSSGSSYILYVPTEGGNMVGICPDASSLSNINKNCNGIYYLNEDSPNVEIATEGGDEYWKISGLTNTGGFSLSGINDTMTRQQIGTESNHDIEFMTSIAIDSSGDTIVVDFVPNQSTTDGSQDFDFNGIDVGDIDLEDDGADKTLCAGANPCSAGAGIWGVNISTGSNDTVTFTAPTDAGASEISAGSILNIKIGLNATSQSSGDTQIKNPTVSESYEVHIRLDNGSSTDFGELEIPVVDDDTVNVTSYLDTVLTFDIDTASSNVNCDASGGSSPCDSHSSASDDSGYVVDLGEMTLSSVNRSGDSVLHADGLTGNINYIWFDLESNSDGGVVVTLVSQHESMYMDASNEIPDVATGSEQQITAADGLYGLNHRSGFTNSAVSGSLVVHVDCDCTSGDDYYCDVSDGGTPIEVFNSNSGPVDDGRVQWAIGVAPDSSDGTGTYTDQLTFVATSTF